MTARTYSEVLFMPKRAQISWTRPIREKHLRARCFELRRWLQTTSAHIPSELRVLKGRAS